MGKKTIDFLRDFLEKKWMYEGMNESNRFGFFNNNDMMRREIKNQMIKSNVKKKKKQSYQLILLKLSLFLSMNFLIYSKNFL